MSVTPFSRSARGSAAPTVESPRFREQGDPPIPHYPIHVPIHVRIAVNNVIPPCVSPGQPGLAPNIAPQPALRRRQRPQALPAAAPPKPALALVTTPRKRELHGVEHPHPLARLRYPVQVLPTIPQTHLTIPPGKGLLEDER